MGECVSIKKMNGITVGDLMKIPPVPPPDPDNFGAALQRLEESISMASAIRKELLTSNQKLEIDLISVTWLTALHVVYRNKWQKKHRIPLWRNFDKDTRATFTAFANHLEGILDLCLQAYLEKRTDPASWWVCILQEMHESEVNNVLKRTSYPDQKGKKQRSVDRHRETIRQIDSLENPLNPIETPHTYQLIAAAIKRCENVKIFKSKHLKPFLKTWRAWITEIERNPSVQTPIEESGILKVSRGPGRGMKPVFQSGSTISENSRAEKVIQCEFQRLFRETEKEVFTG